MKGYYRLIASVTLCSALVPAGFAQESCPHPRIITVTGTAELKVPPNEAILALGLDSRDKELAVAKASNDQRVKKALKLAHDAGIEAKNTQTSALTMGPEYSEEKIPKFLDYQVSQTIALTLTDLSKYEGLMTSLLKAGVNRVDGISFLVSDQSKYKGEARLKAIQAAREKATAMATELGQKIGAPWEITEESDVDSPVLSPVLTANVRGYAKMPMMEPMSESTVAGGELTIRASIRVSFQLE